MLALPVSLTSKGEILCWNPAERNELVQLHLLAVCHGAADPLWMFL